METLRILLLLSVLGQNGRSEIEAAPEVCKIHRNRFALSAGITCPHQDCCKKRGCLDNRLSMHGHRQDPHFEGMFAWHCVNEVAQIEVAVLGQMQFGQLLASVLPGEIDKGR